MKESLHVAKKIGKTLSGVVISNKMQKSIVVSVERTVQHRLYGKILRKTTKIHAHDEHNACREGDHVLIREGRPLSKTKSWVLQEILERSVA